MVAMVDVDQLSQALHAQITSKLSEVHEWPKLAIYRGKTNTPKKKQLFWGEGLLKETTNP